MSAEERVLSLFDTWWFEQRVFSLSEPEIRPPPPLMRGEDLDSGEPKLNRIGTLMRKSHSDNLLSSKDFSSESPNSVLGVGFGLPSYVEKGPVVQAQYERPMSHLVGGEGSTLSVQERGSSRV